MIAAVGTYIEREGCDRMRRRSRMNDDDENYILMDNIFEDPVSEFTQELLLKLLLRLISI